MGATDSLLLNNKVAIVTGAGRGIGRGIAIKLAERGAAVVVADMHEGNAKDASEELARLGTRSMAIAVDVTRKKDVEAMTRSAVDAFGRVDILVNNAGWDKIMPFVETTEELWDKILAINLKGVMNCCRAAVDPMARQGYGKIINVASDAGRVGSTGEVVYSGAKGGVIAFSKALAREMSRHNILINVVCPGPTESETYGPTGGMMAERDPKLEEQRLKIVEALTRSIPLKRRAKVGDIAEAVAFFASPAADYLTGQTLSVNGGLNMV